MDVLFFSRLRCHGGNEGFFKITASLPAQITNLFKATLKMHAAVVGMNNICNGFTTPTRRGIKSIAARILVDDSLSTFSEKRASVMAHQLRVAVAQDDVSLSRRTYGVRRKPISLGRKVFFACKGMWQSHFRKSCRLTADAVVSEIEKFSDRLEDARVLIIITSGIGSDLDIPYAVYELARRQDIQIMSVCLDSSGKKAAILKKQGLQIHFSETPNYSDEVIINLLRCGISS